MDVADVLHVEICQKNGSTLPKDDVQNLALNMIDPLDEIPLNIPLFPRGDASDALSNHIESVLCSCEHEEKSHMKIQGANLRFHVYRLNEDDCAIETLGLNESEDLPVSSHWILPSREFHYLWDNLYYETDMKENLLRFMETAIVFSEHQVDPNVISWNKVILLHGPPGTGKTSMCKALAQKLAIRFSDRFSHGELIEINSHSLFSKWFSESGKLVMLVFNEIKRILENTHALVCILIDEIESLAHLRKASTNGTEPTDSIRVVNALLTRLDQIKRHPNVLILTTSNMTGAIDLAFVDRADIKQYVGYPTEQAIYKIYYSCLKELMRTNLLEQNEIYDMHYLKMHGYEENADTKNSLKLLELSRESIGLSARTLRKIPFLAHALYVHSRKCALSKFLRFIHLAVQKHKEESLE